MRERVRERGKIKVIFFTLPLPLPSREGK